VSEIVSTDTERDDRAIDLISDVLHDHCDRLERSLRGKALAPDWQRFDRELAADLERALRQIVEAEDPHVAHGFFDGWAEREAKAVNAEVRDADKLDGAVDRARAGIPFRCCSLVAAVDDAREDAGRP
jgi:hypothetical protein